MHRALDTAGALLGALVAFALLGLVPGAYDVIFVVSFCVAVVGLGVLLFLVSNATSSRGGFRGGRRRCGRRAIYFAGRACGES